MKKNNLRENIDYIKNKNGEKIFTREYLIARGQCCKSGCTNCPYDFHKDTDPNVPQEYSLGWTHHPLEEDLDDEN